MQLIKIEVTENGAPSATIAVPVWMARSAANMLPPAGRDRFTAHADLDELATLAASSPAGAVLLEIEDFEAGEKIVVSVLGK